MLISQRNSFNKETLPRLWYHEQRSISATLGQKSAGAMHTDASQLRRDQASHQLSQLVVVYAWHLQGETMLAKRPACLPRAKLDALREGERQHRWRWLASYVGRYVGRLGPEAESYLKPEMRLIKGLPT
jgi:hypothetical protein